jgi:hypothetical protein
MEITTKNQPEECNFQVNSENFTQKRINCELNLSAVLPWNVDLPIL